MKSVSIFLLALVIAGAVCVPFASALQSDVIGVFWNGTSSSPTLSRVDWNNNTVSSPDFNNTFPWREMVRDNSSESWFQNQTLVKVPAFYYYIKRSADNVTVFYIYGNTSANRTGMPANFKLHPAFYVNQSAVKAFYMSAYEGSVQFKNGTYNTGDFAGVNSNAAQDKLSSFPGMKPASGANNAITMTGFRNLSQSRGINWEIASFNHYSAIQLMYLVEYASFYSQSVLSAGVTQITDDGSTNMAVYTGCTAGVGTGCTNLGNASGQATISHYQTGQTTYPMSYRGVENVYGNINKWVSGINIKADRNPWIANYSYSADTFSGSYQDTGLILPSSNGYGVKIANNSILEYGFLPSVVGASISTFFTDYYSSNTGSRCQIYGGGWNSGNIGGIVYQPIGTASSYIGRDLSARLDLTKPIYANFTYTQSGNTIYFSDLSYNVSTVTGLQKNVTSWNWSFGDGNVSTLQNPGNVYPVAGGIYYVNLTVSDGTYSDTFLSSIEFPASSFTPSGATSVTYPNGVAFTDTSTGSPTAWEWSYKTNGVGAGTIFNASQNPYFAPPAIGNYTIHLNVSTATSYNISTQITWVNVSPVVASFTASPDPGSQGVSVSFTDTSIGTPTAWDWGWGDGTANSTLQNPTHTYTTSGTYYIRLNASNGYSYGEITKAFTVTPTLSNETFFPHGATTGVHFNGTNGATTSQDVIQYKTVAQQSGGGTSEISTNTKKFGSASLHIPTDVTGNAYFDIQNANNAFDFGAQDFSIEFWGNITSLGGGVDRYFVVTNTPTGNGYYLSVTDAGVMNFLAYNGSAVVISIIPTNTTTTGWHHYAVSRNGSIARMFKDGTFVGNSTPITRVMPAVTGNLHIGDRPLVSSGDVYIDEFVIVQGNATYTSDFTPPSSEYKTAVNVADFTNDPVYPSAGDVVQFTDTTSSLPSTTAWSWVFGDGGTSILQNPTHTFALAGNYTVNLTTFNGVTFNTSSHVVSVDIFPNASFSGTPTSLYSGNPVSFTDLSTGGGTINTWLWEFGDGATSVVQNPSHIYTSGLYTVNLTVTNTLGVSNKSSVAGYITVYNSSYPRAEFTCSPLSGSPSLLVTCTNMTMGGVTPFEYNWSWGDGTTTISEFNPSHVYAYSGIYTVSLVVSNTIANVTQVRSDYIIVSTNQNNVWYSPHQVRFRILDSYGAPINSLDVNATAVANTLPSEGDLQYMYGIDPVAANEMLNNTLIMSGTTGNDGAVVFTMLGSIGYDIKMNNPVRGGMFTTYVMPIDTQYNIWVNTSTLVGTDPANSVYIALQNTTLWFAEPNVSYIRLGVNYTDSSGKTEDITWYIKNGNNNTVVYSQDLGNPGTGTVSSYYDIRNLRGYTWIWNYTAVRTE